MIDVFMRSAWSKFMASVGLLVLSTAVAAAAETGGLDHFEKHVRPIFIEHCYKCHSAEAEKIKGGLLLDSKAGVLKGGDHGPVLVPGKPNESRLIAAVRYEDEKLQMPPKTRLSDEQVQALIKWVELGAPDPRDGEPGKPRRELAEAKKFWSFQPVKNPPVPSVRKESWPRSPIDFFVLSELEKAGLEPVASAKRRALIRRATFDLTGLPPSPSEIDAFLNDAAPLDEAFARVVDRLLASPQYGERWGRHWLDLVRYADTAGDNSDYPVPELYRYRNYVIQSFNQDKPYDQFLIEQIAGDLLPAKDQEQRNEQIIATGYIALSRRFGSVINNYPQHLTIEDTLDNMGRAFLGLTITCARCHDHKFDAISKEDYYGLYGFFESTRYPFPGIELDKIPRDFVPLLPQEEYDAVMAPFNAQVAELDEKLKAAREERKIAGKENRRDLIADLDRKIREIEKKRVAAQKDQPRVPLAYAILDAKPQNAKLHERGDPKKLGPEIPRKFLDLLGGQALPESDRTSGRLHLARWIAAPENPLTARVMVNRIWQQHFGKALVATPSDFGVRGQPPTHPELLDWLAHRFIQEGWSIKAMHRLIMRSRAYQLSTEEQPANLAADPENKWLWRFNRRRLSAEELRDSMLLLAGKLDVTPMNEAHPFPPAEKWEYTQHFPFKDEYPTARRSVYMMGKRITALAYLQTFDGPDPNASTATRDSSVTTVQALYFLNNDFVQEQAGRFAERVLRERSQTADRVQLAFTMAFARPSAAGELRQLEQFLAAALAKGSDLPPAEQEKRAWTSLAGVLLRSNEFSYLD
jgi:mono/diheme cytochrome c family protein